MPVDNGIEVGTRRGSTGLVEVRGHCFGVASSME